MAGASQEATTKPTRKRAVKKPAVPPAQFQPAESEEPPAPVLRVVPDPEVPEELRCRHRSGCKQQATLRVVGKPWQFCPRHGAEFEVAQEYVVEGRFETEPIR